MMFKFYRSISKIKNTQKSINTEEEIKMGSILKWMNGRTCPNYGCCVTKVSRIRILDVLG